MSRQPGRAWLLICLLVFTAGCADNPMVLKDKVTKYEQQQAVLTRQNSELQARAVTLDKDNQQLQQQLGQMAQQNKISEDQLAALRDQLRGATAQLAQIKTEKEGADKKVSAMTASMQRQNGITITPNNSYLQAMPAINLPDVFVRRDGDVIRGNCRSAGCSRPAVRGSSPARPS
jgi:septal ring factor EnvC (AmiA/AmiB activator)